MALPLSEEEIAPLYRDLFPALFRLATRLVGGDAAEDVVQEAFIAFLKAVRRSKIFADLNPRAYLFRTVTNVAINLLRKRARRREAEEALAQPDAAHDHDPHLSLTIVIALEALSDEDRDLLLLKYYGDLSENEIGEIFGIEPNTASQRLRRARVKLARHLHPLSPDEVSL